MCHKLVNGELTPVNKVRYNWLCIVVVPLYLAVHIGWIASLINSHSIFELDDEMLYASSENPYALYLVENDWRLKFAKRIWISTDANGGCDSVTESRAAFGRTWSGLRDRYNTVNSKVKSSSTIDGIQICFEQSSLAFEDVTQPHTG